MSLQSFTYQHDTQYEGTRDGIPIYDGSATSFHDWSFRTAVKFLAPKPDDKSRVVASVIEGLRGEAADIAMDIGTDELMKEDHTGLTVLTEALRSHIFPKKEAEAKVLYKHGHKKKGILSRQPAEPIVSYVSRRRRWWTQLKQLDSSVELSDTIRGDLLLEAANLGKIESLLVLSSAGNDRKFEAIAKAMQDQHALIHLEEKSARKTDNH